MTEHHQARRIASYRSPKAEVRRSGVEGRGLFAIEAIARDEIVAIKGGHILDEATYQQSKAISGNSDLKIADGFHIVALSPDEYDGVMMFLNHSCEPNVGVQGDVVFVAMRDIAAGEELCLDYALIDDGDDAMACNCGTASCRGVVSERDWQRPELQARYGQYFSSYLLRKIEHTRT
jgi:SET domain-containing protein